MGSKPSAALVFREIPLIVGINPECNLEAETVQLRRLHCNRKNVQSFGQKIPNTSTGKDGVL